MTYTPHIADALMPKLRPSKADISEVAAAYDS